MPRNDRNIVMENVEVRYRNFEGREGEYNAKGDRNFTIIVPESIDAEKMASEGWNVKWKADKRDTDAPEQPQLEVKINFNGRPPRIIMITSRNRTILNEETVELLDSAEFKNVDLIVGPYDWNIGGKTGVKAYLQSMYVTIEEDPLELKYAAMEEAQRPGGFLDEDGDYPEPN